MNELLNLLGYKHVKDKSKTDKDDFLSNWKHVVQTRPFTMSRMNELCDMAKHIRINDDMNARQILLYVNKLLKPYEICIKSYRGKSIT